jgi:3-methyladenine DNA glycosylase AlkD
MAVSGSRQSLKTKSDSGKRITAAQLQRELAAVADPVRAASSVWFFKTGPGEYGEGDRFIGIAVPVLRKIALSFRELPLSQVERLLSSRVHEHRLAGLEILVAQYERGAANQKHEIFDFYLAHTAGINNWDLVDASAPYIVGEHLRGRPRDVLYALAVSANVWERRIAIVSTFAFLHDGDVDDLFAIARKLLADQHDLIRKATGWALREAGKVSNDRLLEFLSAQYAKMSRTTLRYAIERFSPVVRRRILVGDFSAF